MPEKIERFEDFIAWQKARQLTAELYSLSRAGGLARDFGLKDQMRRSAVSIMANIAEGFERGRPAEFHQYLSVAKASCAELRSHLYVALDAGYLKGAEFDALMLKALETGRVIGGLRLPVQRRRDEQ